ncbi:MULTISPECIES: hypothetical protein [unclassified Acidovorax]|uniref:hypothetical protein n=1 Tax=unclassified Acidovorax TaxID=2684926 RepID=UPI000B09F0D2|nr:MULTISPECIES: hypothetical protein [unclassified Acidovorax]
MLKLLLTLIIVSFTEISFSGETSSNIIDYKIYIKYNDANEELAITLQNKSSHILKIREDAAPFSLLVRGINFSGFEETEALNRIPLYYPIGSNPNFIEIPPQGSVTRNIQIKYFMKHHCKITKENSTLIFWNYSARAGTDGEDVMLPSDGVFRINKHKKSCE